MQAQSTQDYGLCECGCGQQTKLAPCSDISKGWKRGEPKRFVLGHSTRGPQGFVAEDRGYLTPCLIWQGAKHQGYGIDRARERVHRKAYEERYGPIPDGLEPDHLCGVKLCGNVDHLEPVTHTVNVRRGTHTKLTIEKAREIRRLMTNGARAADVAAQFGCLRQTVTHIVLNRQWRES